MPIIDVSQIVSSRNPRDYMGGRILDENEIIVSVKPEPLKPQGYPSGERIFTDLGFIGGESTPVHPVQEFKRGIQSSIPGMMYRQEPPLPSQGENIIERTAYSAGQYLGDAPFYVAGGYGGGIAGAFALPAGIRKVLMDTYEKGQAKTWDDVKDRFGGAMLETGKGALVGKVTGIAGKYAPAIAKVPAEIAAMTTAGAAVEGQIPTAQDFIDAAVLIFGMHGVTKGAKMLRQHYAKTGETPQQVVARKPSIEDSKKTQTITLSKEELTKDKYARSINVEKQGIPESQKNLEFEMAQQLEDRFQPKKKQSWEKTEQLAKPFEEKFRQEGKVSIEGIDKYTEQLQAARNINIEMLGNFQRDIQNATWGEAKAIEESYRDNIFKMTSDYQSEAGRALNIQKKIVGINSLVKTIANLKKGMNKEQFEEFKKLDRDNPEAIKEFEQKLKPTGLKEAFWAYWFNNILAGPPTHVVNTASNTSWLSFQVPHRVLAGVSDWGINKLTGRPRQKYMTEFIPLAAGYKKGFVPGAKAAWATFKTGKSQDFESKWGTEMGGVPLDPFKYSKYKFLRKPVVQWAGTGFLKALHAMDVWAKTIAFDGDMESRAYREGIQKGLQGENLKQFRNEYLKKPPDAALEEAKINAKYSVFMDDPGKFTTWIMGLRDIVPGSKLILPFINTPSNLIQRGMEKTPGVGLAFEGYKKASGQKTLPVEEIIANQIEGSLLALYIMYKIDNNEITGAAPIDPARKDAFYRQRKIPWGIKVGNKWRQYKRIEPLNTPIAMVTTAYDKIMNAKDTDTASRVFSDTVRGLGENLIDSSYLSNLSNFLDRYGRVDVAAYRILASFVPYSSFWRSINRSVEVIKERPEDVGFVESITEGYPGEGAKLRNDKSLWGSISLVIPGLSSATPPRINVWGEEIVLPGGVFRQWLPYKWDTATADPVELEFERLGYYPGLPGQSITIDGEKFRLSDIEYRDYAVIVGNRGYKEMQKIIAKPSYQRIKDDRNKLKELDKVMDSIRSHELFKVKNKYRENHINLAR